MTDTCTTRRCFVTGSLAAAGTVLMGCAGPGRGQGPVSAPSASAGHAQAPAPADASEAADARPADAPPAGGGRFAALSGFCDGISAPDQDALAARRERARALARDAGFAALIMEAGSTLRYFTGLRWWLSERPLLYVLPVRGEPVWIGPAFEEGTLRQAAVSQGDLRTWHEHDSPYARTAQALADRGLRTGRVAVEPNLRLFVHHGLREAAPGLDFYNGTAVVDGCRMIKSDIELACMRRANQATKAALRAVAAHVQTGMTRGDLTAMVREAQEVAGLSNIWALVLFGPDAAYPHGTRSQRLLTEGDLILVDTGGSLHGYCSDITRTWAVGAPSAEQRQTWQVVSDAQQAAMEQIRPGVACGAVDAAARAVIANAGHGSDYQHFTHRLGHGIGLDVHEAPYLVRGSARVLQPGMTMSNEPGIYVPQRFGIRIEDIVAVTADGHEVFGPRATSIESP